MNIVRYIKNKKLLLFFFIASFYKLYKNKTQILFFIYKLTKKGKKHIKEKQSKALTTIKKKVFDKKWMNNFNNLSLEGKNIDFIKDIVHKRKQTLNHKISGTLYNNEMMNKTIANYMYDLYMYSNPLHSDLYPELNKMESEIVKMVGKLFDLPTNGGGNLTTGGTESTILAIKAYKKYKLSNTLFSRQLEVITTKTGHAAINKACELLDLKLIYVKLNKEYVMDINDLKSKITSKTCVVIASSPCYPYGLIDPITEIGNICKQNNVPLHVDACLGGFITQFNDSLKISFNDNINSISVDPHKFGYAPKGSSLLLWKNNTIRHKQYFIVEKWTGGIYASPSLPGSRAGGQIATTWGILMYNGLNYYKNIANKIMLATRKLVKQINSLQTFKVIGNPMVNVVAFNSDIYSLGQIIEMFQKNGWNLNIMQNPLCLHICITPYNIDKIDEIVNILKIITSKKVEDKDEGLVSIYGMAEKIPDKTIIHEIIEQYLDLTTNL
jgi:glutamate/tyrosine decarboxylase-like PLP-dependent enzyme